MNAQDDCITANPFCTSTGVSYPAGVDNGDAAVGPDYECLLSQPNPAWYYLNISQAGNINISLTNSSAVDIDFIIWGPFNNITCNNNQLSSNGGVFGCLSYPCGNVVDCSYSTAASETVNIPNAQVGQWYMLMVTNFSNMPTEITATQTSGTGATNCAILCTFNGITANPTACNQATQQYNVSGTITVTDPPSTGTLTITNSCGGAPIVLNPPFASSIPYTFSNLTANGSSCAVTATFSADPTCTGTVNYNAPAPCAVTPCNVDFLQADIAACDFANNSYDVTGYVEFSNAPATGQLIIETCGGQQVTFNAPFVSPINYSILDIPSDGAACDVTAYFSATPACTNSVAYVAPDPCVCAVNAGTFNATTTGDTNNPEYLCYSDQFSIVSNNDYLFSANVFDDDTLYNPAIWYLVYACPPTVGQGGLIETDPCLVGTLSTQDIADLNDGSFIAQFPAGTFTNNTVYFTPITMYDVTTGTYSFTNFDGMCYDLGSTYTYTYLPEIIEGTSTQDCAAQTLTVSFSGGAPELLGTQFTATNLFPANAFIVDATAPNNGNIVVGGLLEGDVVTFTIEDQYGCPYAFTSEPFVGPAIPTISNQSPLCVSDAPVQLNATPIGGTWSGQGVSSTGIFDPAIAGVGTEIISYTPNGCAVTGNLNITVFGPLDATIVNPGSFCIDANPITLTAANPGGTWSGLGITNPATGAFNPNVAGAGTTTITYTIGGSCGDSDIQTITVNPLPVVSFTADVNSGCAPLSVTLTNTSVPVGNGCTWWVDGVPSGNNCASLNYTFNTQGCYDIQLSTTDGNGCSSNSSITDYICVSQQPVSTFSWSPISPNVGNTTVQFINYSLGAVNYDWTIMDMYYLNAPEPVFTFPNEAPGEYSVCLLVTNADGCTDLSCGTVAISDQFSIFVPNCFTPNADGRNELFMPSIRGESLIQTYEFKIFNRWGDVLFETKDINEGWYGEVYGGEYYAIDAVYSWLIKILPKNGQEPFEQTGHVTVIR
ncbi:MAG: gliding motility-associated C-terminal domain-containing protein [Flavobacteriales bacterium]|nr:gliding motility-associated C-terminal domain-containing protein [Flavobacteriales bacterium]